MPDEQQNSLSPAGLKALKEELEHLETEGRREIAERIRVARDFGDLKENSEYHDAKNDQAMLETKILRLADRLRSAVVVEPATGGEAAVAFGSTVSVVDESSGREATWTIVGATEADTGAGRLSAESPVARALMGARPGETVTVETPRGP